MKHNSNKIFIKKTDLPNLKSFFISLLTVSILWSCNVAVSESNSSEILPATDEISNLTVSRTGSNPIVSYNEATTTFTVERLINRDDGEITTIVFDIPTGYELSEVDTAGVFTTNSNSNPPSQSVTVELADPAGKDAVASMELAAFIVFQTGETDPYTYTVSGGFLASPAENFEIANELNRNAAQSFEVTLVGSPNPTFTATSSETNGTNIVDVYVEDITNRTGELVEIRIFSIPLGHSLSGDQNEYLTSTPVESSGTDLTSMPLILADHEITNDNTGADTILLRVWGSLEAQIALTIPLFSVNDVSDITLDGSNKSGVSGMGQQRIFVPSGASEPTFDYFYTLSGVTNRENLTGTLTLPTITQPGIQFATTDGDGASGITTGGVSLTDPDGAVTTGHTTAAPLATFYYQETAYPANQLKVVVETVLAEQTTIAEAPWSYLYTFMNSIAILQDIPTSVTETNLSFITNGVLNLGLGCNLCASPSSLSDFQLEATATQSGNSAVEIFTPLSGIIYTVANNSVNFAVTNIVATTSTPPITGPVVTDLVIREIAYNANQITITKTVTFDP